LELKTEHGLALRAGRGMLVSTDRASGGASSLEAGPAQTQVEASHLLHTSLTETAQKHNARLPEEGKPEELLALAALAHSAEVLGSTTHGSGDDAGGGSSAVAFPEAQLQLSTPSGIAALTPASARIAAGATGSIAAGQDINFAAQGGAYHTVKAGISLFTYGKASASSKPNAETGIRLHAASGKVSSQSQSGATRLTADKGITVASVTSSVTVAAKEHVLLTAQGAYIKLSGGNIEVHGPGTMMFKGSAKELAGPQSASSELPALPHPDHIANNIELNFRYDDLDAVPNAAYIVTFANGAVRKGTLDGKGHALLTNVPSGEYTVELGEDPRDWSAPPEPEPDYKNPQIRAQAERAIQEARAAFERGQA
jgi:type VI secretion system secreted protein VgrG